MCRDRGWGEGGAHLSGSSSFSFSDFVMEE